MTALPLPVPRSQGFVDFDERLLVHGATPSVIVVHADVRLHTAIVAHAARRLRTRGHHPCVLVSPFATTKTAPPRFREVGARLGLSRLPLDPCACAEVIGEAAVARKMALLATLPEPRSWDGLVARELAREPRTLLVFVTSSANVTSLAGPSACIFELTSDLGAEGKLRWLSAVAEEAQRTIATTELGMLEGWWRSAARATGERRREEAEAPISSEARTILVALALAGTSLPFAALRSLVETLHGGTSRSGLTAFEELVTLGLVHEATRSLGAKHDRLDEEGRLWAAVEPDAVSTLVEPTGHELRRALARCLTKAGPGFEPDPWSYARAAELRLEAGALREADEAIVEAERRLRGEGHPAARAEIGQRWFDAVLPLRCADALELRRKAAKRALDAGDARGAQRWCEAARSVGGSDPSIDLLLARATMAVGDLVGAKVCLGEADAAAHALDAGPARDELVAKIGAERAEVAYLGGHLDEAAREAGRAIASATTEATRLAARGTLGKILLARGDWPAADEHFAADALAAAAAGERTAELRARLNRAIAMLSNGRLDDARVHLERVERDAENDGEDRARAYALSNLGLVAYRQRDYGAALHYWESAIRLPQALRGRLATALTMGNLAELRLRLGLVEHAEHAVLFGRRLLGTSTDATPARCSALFKWVSAQIALARRNTELARREADGAVADAEASGERDYLESAYLVSARVALDDGELGRTADALLRASAVAKSARAKAELAILEAAHLRALGRPALDAGEYALEAARVAGEEDLLFETHLLLAQLQRDIGNTERARDHAGRAASVRDQIALGLPPSIRSAFLAKPEITSLGRLQAALERPAVPDVDEPEAPRISIRTEPPEGAHEARELVGDDPHIRALVLAIQKVARVSSTVLVRGESGTGKELVAEALHRASDRSLGPLVTVNCAALVENLLLSELFGHEKGSFTGASTRRRGRFELAEGGTLFLDEIGDISARTQVALLRVLQEKSFERVGGTTPIRANVRVVCATHRDLRAMVERGEFREDLYYRLRGVTLEVPPLRARAGDVPKIADHLLGRIALERSEARRSLTQEALELLARYRWPGNVRELENVLRAVSIFAEGDLITVADLVDNVDELRRIAQESASSHPPVSVRSLSGWTKEAGSEAELEVDDDGEGEAFPASFEGSAPLTTIAFSQVRQGKVSLSTLKRQIEKDCISRALAETNGNITRAAALLGMKRPRLSQLVKQYGLTVASSESS